MRLRFLVYSFSCVCAVQIPAYAIEITNFKSGLACVEKHADQSYPGWICHETESIPITGQGKCVYNGEEYPCTWYGFEFEYANADEGERIRCVLSGSHGATFGNPKTIERTNSQKYEYEIAIPSGSGRFFNPQYSIVNYSRHGAKVTQEETVCSADNVELFRFKFDFLYPQSRNH